MIREVHGVAIKDNHTVRVQDDAEHIRLSIGVAWQKLTPEEARFIGNHLLASAKRIETRDERE